MKNMLKFYRVLMLASVVFGVLGCAPQEPREPKPKASSRHDMSGEIVGVVTERRTLLVHHKEIPGYMPEMTMEFGIGEADIRFFKEGQRIAASMIEDPESAGEFRLEGIRVLEAAKDAAVEGAAKRLQEETLIMGKRAFREIGEVAPEFALYNQAGEVVRFDKFRGKRVVLNFIFTRCPVATMCPASTARMVSLQRLAKERNIVDFELVSITLDPVYDTPAVLKTYGETRGADFQNFTYLTGPEAAIKSLLVQFGILAQPSDNIWKHTLSTVLIDRTGKIAFRIDGSDWTPEDFLKRL
jgi:protein SCO1